MRDKKNVRREPGKDGKILSDHRQDGNDEVHRLVFLQYTKALDRDESVERCMYEYEYIYRNETITRRSQKRKATVS